MDTRGERRFVRVLQALVMAVEPLDHGFQREARIEAGGAGIGVGEIFRAGGVGMHVGEFGCEEGELRHGPQIGLLRGFD